MRTSLFLMALGLILAGAACGDSSADETVEPRSIRGELALGPTFAVQSWDSAIEVELDLGGVVAQRELPLTGGFFELSADEPGDLYLEDLVVFADNIAVGDKGLPPTGFYLSDVRVVAKERHRCDRVVWADGDESCAANIPSVLWLRATWHVSDGATLELELPLATDVRAYVQPGPLGLRAQLVADESRPTDDRAAARLIDLNLVAAELRPL